MKILYFQSMQHSIEALLRKNPRLKAAEIAKAIGAERKEVSAYLHSNKKDFVQDAEYRWSIANSNELKIEFESGWVDCQSFERSLKKKGSPSDASLQSILFVIPEECKLMLEAAARLLALCNQLVYNGKKVTIDFSGCRSTLTYFDRIGFFDHLNGKISTKPKRPTKSRASKYNGNSNAVVEFGGIDKNKDNKSLVIQLTERFVAQSSDRYYTAAFTIFAELIGNVVEHSNAPFAGFAALQKYDGRKKHIQTVVSDGGVGIAATLRPSLRQHYPSLHKLYSEENVESDMALVLTAIKKGEISKSGLGHGLGFKRGATLAMKFDAHLSIRQRDFSLELVYKGGVLSKINKNKSLIPIAGTHICFDFFVD